MPVILAHMGDYKTLLASRGIIAAVETTSAGVVITDARQPENPIIFANAAFEAVTGYAVAEIIGRNCRFLQGPESDGEAVAEIRSAVGNGQPLVQRIVNYRKDGSTFWNELTTNPIIDADNELIGHVGLIRDVTSEVLLQTELDQKIEALKELNRVSQAANSELANAVNYDPVTGLPTRKYIYEQLDQAMKRSRRNGEELALVLLNLDGFKNVNDRFGHETGDLALRTAAERMRGQIRETDVLARLGGDEFVLLLNTPATDTIIAEIVDRITRVFSMPVDLGSGTAPMGVSIGFARFPHDGGDVSSLMKHADAAMREHKNGSAERLENASETQVA